MQEAQNKKIKFIQVENMYGRETIRMKRTKQHGCRAYKIVEFVAFVKERLVILPLKAINTAQEMERQSGRQTVRQQRRCRDKQGDRQRDSRGDSKTAR